MFTCADFAQALVNITKKILHQCDEGRVIFDRYIENSLKSQTRVKRTSGTDPVRFYVSNATSTKYVPLKTLVAHIETKGQLTEYLGKALLQAYLNSQISLIVVYGISRYSNHQAVFSDIISQHNHEEADTIIPLHVLDALSLSPRCNVDARSPDTDVFILLMDLCARDENAGNVNFITGQGKFNRRIDVRSRSTVVCKEKSKALIGLHAISGADWGGKLIGISKLKWITLFLKLPDDDDMIPALQSLGTETFNLEGSLNCIQKFLRLIYSPVTKKTTVNELRWELFNRRNMEAEKLPRTLGALIPHIQRANIIANIWRGYRNAMNVISPVTENGGKWLMASQHQKMPLAASSTSSIETCKCGCKGRCKGRNICSCLKNHLSCDDFCKCEDCDNRAAKSC